MTKTNCKKDINIYVLIITILEMLYEHCHLVLCQNKLLTYMYNLFINEGHPERVYLFYEYLKCLEKNQSFQTIMVNDDITRGCFLRLCNIPTEICKRNPVKEEVDTYLINAKIPCLANDVFINMLLVFFEGIK